MALLYDKQIIINGGYVSIFSHDSGSVAVSFEIGPMSVRFCDKASEIRALAAALIEAADAVEVKEPAVDFAQVEVE
jgi:hypothetical protein